MASKRCLYFYVTIQTFSISHFATSSVTWTLSHKRRNHINVCLPLPFVASPETPLRRGDQVRHFQRRQWRWCLLRAFSEHRAKEGDSFIRKTCPPKLVWAGSISSRGLAAGHWEVKNPLSHFSTARTSGLKKPNIPPKRPAKCLLKKRKEGSAQS